MRNATIAGLALVSAQYGILTWLMLYLRDHAHIALTRGAFFLSLAQAAGVLGRVGLAASSDRTPGLRFRLLTLSMIAVAGGVLLLMFVPPADKVGLTLGAAMALNQLGIIAAPPLLGLVHDLTGGYAALWAGVVAILALAYALTARRSP